MNKYLMVFLLFLLSFAQQKNTASVKQISASRINQAKSPLQKSVVFTDYRKFYIGFLYRDHVLDVITLTIRTVEQQDSTLKMSYTINSHNSRRNGTGEIDPGKSLIRFENLAVGRILKPQDGKLVFESMAKDSLNYWKLKEK